MMSPMALWYPLHQRKNLKEQRRQTLAEQFRDGASSVAAAVSCGYSIENAFMLAAAEMEAIHGPEGYITGEFRSICQKLSLNQTVEEAVRDLADRSGLAELEQFAEVFAAAKRSSGDLPAILKDTAELLGRKISLRREIRTMVAAKKLEQSIMSLMPAGILVYVNLASPGYTEPLYGSMGGRIMMTVCLILYGIAVWWGQKILDIDLR